MFSKKIIFIFIIAVCFGFSFSAAAKVLTRPHDKITRVEFLDMLIGAKADSKIIGKFSRSGYVKMGEGLKMAFDSFKINVGAAPKGGQWYEPYVEFTHQNNIFSKFAYLPGREMIRKEASKLVEQIVLVKTGKKVFSGKRNNKSKGCGKIPPKIPPKTSVVRGVSRNYITVIPKTYDKNTPIKLVFAFHGRTNSNEMVRGYYGVEEVSKGKAIFIYPAGMRVKGGFSWSNAGDSPDKIRDFALFDQLLKEFSENYCIDLDNVYVVGHSLGGWFTDTLACGRGDVIRAIATIGGGTTTGNCTGPVAAMVWHNPKDNLVSFSQGEKARDQFKMQNGCGNVNVPAQPPGANCVSFKGCDKYAPFTWCPYTVNTDWQGRYYPHTWPGFAGKEIWKFFENLPG